MAQKEVIIRNYKDGRLEIETVNITGPVECTKIVNKITQYVGGTISNAEKTDDYFKDGRKVYTDIGN